MNVAHVATLGNARGGPLYEMRLAGVAVAPDDHLFTVGDDSIKQFTTDQTLAGEFELGGLGWSLYAEQDVVWVGMDGKLMSFTRDGKSVVTIQDGERLGRVTAVAAAGDELVLADATHRAVRRYSRTGRYLGDLGTAANTRGFMIPNGVLDLVSDKRNQTVLVAHPQKHRVERYAASGALVAKWGKFGMHDPSDFGGCCNPTNIAVASDGTVAVSEKAPPRIKLYDADGTFELLIDQDIFDPNTKNIDLDFDSQHRLYATDPARRVVHILQLANIAESVS